MQRTDGLCLLIIGAIAALILLITVVASAAPNDGGQLFPVKSGQLVGYIDVNGTVMINPQFSDAKTFAEGLAPAQDVDSGKWGYIDNTGKFIIQPQFNKAFPFSEGLAEVWTDSANSGYIDAGGRLVAKGSGGFVREGLIRIRTKEKTIFTDKHGSVLLEVPDDAWQVGSGLFAFMKDGRMGFMDRSGKVVIRPEYHRVIYWDNQQFEERITPVSIGPLDNSKYGFIDRNGNLVVGFEYDWAEQFFDGLARVTKDGKDGFINTAGEVVISPQYEEACHFSEGLAAVKVGGLWGFIDMKGRMVIAPKYLSREWGSPMVFNEGLAAIRIKTGTGFINKAGEMVVPAIYRSVDDFEGGLARVGSIDNPSYINRRGEIVWFGDKQDAAKEVQ
ncbi:MAG: hypothetical protein H6Q67_1972 [Firmicutes bacterium]|nr:hypothetical protein [Bacillota bacterium]